MIILNVTYMGEKDKLNSFLRTVKDEGLDTASRNEPGNVKYDYFFPENGADELLLVEKWSNRDTFELHKREPHFRRLGKIKEAFGIDTTIEKFTV